MTDRESSQRLSRVLRHQPDAAGVTLDAAGWADVDALLAGALHREFFRTGNGVWLTDAVPVGFVEVGAA